MRDHRRSLVVAVISAVSVLLAAGPALAHAGVDSISPKDGSTVRKAPASVRVSFNEQVTYQPENVQLLDQAGRVLPAKVSSSSPAGRTVVTITPTRTPGKGTLTARWAIVSADGHPVSGAAAWVIGAPRSSRATSVTAQPGTIRVTVSSTNPGPVKLTMATKAKTGTVTIESPKLGAPLIWPLTGNGTTATARGVIPFPGTWTLKFTLRTGTFTETAATATLAIR